MNEEFIIQLFDKFDTSSVKELQIQKDGVAVYFNKNADSTQYPAQSYTPAYTHHNTHAPQVSPAAQAPAAVTSQAVSETAVSKASKATEVKASKTEKAETIQSPIVGTFYRSPSPDSPPYVEKGKKVKKGDAICILEAMKMMNTLEAEFDCIIEDILVENGELVEFNQDLFTITKI